MRFYGIDLGTNNCVISCLDPTKENGKLTLLKDKDNNEKIKSVLSLKDKSNVNISEIDSNDLNNTFHLVKGKLGSEKNVLVNNEKLSVQFCAALLLRYLKDFEEDINDVVITIPTFYNQSKRNATIEAAQQAGFKKIKLIEEPTAAVMYHIYSDKSFIYKEKKVLVFDFGAGTLDLSLVDIKLDSNKNIDPKVIAIDGLDNFGGYLIDILFAKALIDEARQNENENIELLNLAYDTLEDHIASYKDKHCYELYKADDKLNYILYSFIAEAERVKIALSSEESVNINIPGYLDIEIEREDFQEIILQNEMIINSIEELLLDFKIKNNYKFDEIILVGGSAQIPLIKEVVKGRFTSSNIITKDDYINAVGYGAAIVSALESGEHIKPFGGNICTGVLPRDIFIRCNGKEEKIFDKGTAYPLKNSKEYVFAIPFSLIESIKISLYEKDNKKSYKISDISFYHPCFYTGDEIKLIINIDKNGLLFFKACHVNTNEIIEFTSEKENSLSEKQIINGNKFIDKNVNFGGNNYGTI